MTDLTEKWKKGELPSGWYYTLVNGGSYEDYTSTQFYNEYTNEFDKHPLITKQVLAKVPSYEEYTKLKEELKDYEYQHKQDGICYNDIFCKLELARKENRQLKELLKEHREEIGDEINAELKAENERLKTFLKKAVNLVMESNWENHAHYKESIQLRDETNNLLNDSPSPTDLKQG